MRSLLLLLFSLAAYRVTYGQDRLVTVDSITIPCRIQSATSRLVYFTDLNANRPDSLPTLRLREVQYVDSVRMVVIPASQRGQVRLLAFADFDKAWRQGAYATLLHAKTSRYDLAFLTGQVALTNEGRRQALALATLLKTKPAIHVRMTVHTDTLGQSAANKALSDRRAAALQNFFATNGIDSRTLLVEGRGESEAISRSQALNRRVELQVVAIDGVNELYGESYVPQRQATPKVTQVYSRQETANKQRSQVIKRKNNYRSVAISLAGNVSKLLIKPLWIDPKVGYGFSYSGGAFASLDVSINPRLSIGVQGAFHQWSSHITYLNAANGSPEFRLRSTLQLIPVQLIPRFYLSKFIYVAPLIGVSHMLLTVDNEVELYKTDQWQLSYGGEVGLTFNRTGRIPVSVSSYYQTSAVRGHWAYWYGFSQASYAGVRFGLAYKLN